MQWRKLYYKGIVFFAFILLLFLIQQPAHAQITPIWFCIGPYSICEGTTPTIPWTAASPGYPTPTIIPPQEAVASPVPTIPPVAIDPCSENQVTPQPTPTGFPPKFIGQGTIPSQKNGGMARVYVNNLIPGATYKIVISGTINFRRNVPGRNNVFADAQWGDDGSIPRGKVNCWCNPYTQPYFNGARLTAQNPEFNPYHSYTFMWTANSAQLEMHIQDSFYPDNSGSLSYAMYLEKLPQPPVVIPTPCIPPSQPSALISSISYPPNITTCHAVSADTAGGVAGEYCKMPPSIDGSYIHIRSGTNRNWGSKELIGVLYTVAQRWKQQYPQGHLQIQDMTDDGHLSHFWGIAVDVLATTNGNDCVADYVHRRCIYSGPYNRQATIELGKMFVDTGMHNTIWYNDTAVNAAVFAYAKEKFPNKYTTNTDGKPGFRPIVAHDDHFHLNISRDRLKDCRNSIVPREVCNR